MDIVQDCPLISTFLFLQFSTVIVILFRRHHFESVPQFLKLMYNDFIRSHPWK